MTINQGDAVTTNANVTLQLTASDNSGAVSAMRFSNEGFAFSGWEPFATNKAWTLSAGDGPKTVYAQFKDAVDNVSIASWALMPTFNRTRARRCGETR